MKKLFTNIPLDEIHQKILNSILKSNEFDDEIYNVYVAILLDMFIHKNDGLQFFFDKHVITKEDFEIFFKQPIIEYYDEKTYFKLFDQIGEI